MACAAAPIPLRGWLAARVTVAGRAAEADNATRGEVPEMHAWKGNSPALGGVAVEATGRFFGTAELCFAARVGGSAAEGTWWVSASSLALRVARGGGVGRALALTAVGGAATVSQALTFDAPRVADAARAAGGGNLPGAGRATVAVRGASFGGVDSSARARLGQPGTACEASAWVADTAAQCRTARGSSAEAALALTVAGAAPATLLTALAFDAPAVAAAARNGTNAPARGAPRVLLHGSAFGSFDHSAGARAGRSAGEASAWASDSAVECLPARGLGAGLGMAVTIATRAGTLSAAFSFDAPTAVGAAPGNAPTAGGREAALSGANLLGHSHGASGRARLGGTACRASAWASDSAVLCRTASGAGAARAAAVTVALQAGTLSGGLSYDSVVLLGAAPSNTRTLDGAAALRAASLAPFDQSPAARVGGSACVRSDWVSDSALHCRTPRALSGGRPAATVTIAGRAASVSDALSYDGPEVLDAAEHPPPRPPPPSY